MQHFTLQPCRYWSLKRHSLQWTPSHSKGAWSLQNIWTSLNNPDSFLSVYVAKNIVDPFLFCLCSMKIFKNHKSKGCIYELMLWYAVLHKVLVVLICKILNLNSNLFLCFFFLKLNMCLKTFALHCMWGENEVSSWLFHVVLLAKHTEGQNASNNESNQWILRRPL